MSYNAPSRQDASLQRPNCQCGLPALTRIVKKDCPNKGKSFWRCGVEGLQQCDFFQLQDASSGRSIDSLIPSLPLASSSTLNAIIPAKRTLSQQTDASLTSVRRCYCDMIAVLKEITRGPSAGMKFWMCPKVSEKVRCKYSEKAVEPDRSASSTSGYTTWGSSETRGGCLKVSLVRRVVL